MLFLIPNKNDVKALKANHKQIRAGNTECKLCKETLVMWNWSPLRKMEKLKPHDL